MSDKMEIYHAATEPVATPLCSVGRKNLDFGPGFYMTDIYVQAIMWANRRTAERQKSAILNVYLLDRESLFKEARQGLRKLRQRVAQFYCRLQKRGACMARL